MENDELKNNENEKKESAIADENLIPETEEIIENSVVEVPQASETMTEENVSEEMPIDQEDLGEEPDLTEQEEQEEKDQEQERPIKKSSNWLRKSLLFLMIAVLLVLAGYLISYFTITVPNQTAYQSLMSDLTKTESDLENLQVQYDQISVDLQETQNKLSLAQGENVTLQHDYNDLLVASEYNLNLLNLKYEIGLARFALLDDDSISARQALSLANNYFDAIQGELDDEISTGIADRLKNIQSSISANTSRAENELRTLAENLERIPLK